MGRARESQPHAPCSSASILLVACPRLRSALTCRPPALSGLSFSLYLAAEVDFWRKQVVLDEIFRPMCGSWHKSAVRRDAIAGRVLLCPRSRAPAAHAAGMRAGLCVPSLPHRYLRCGNLVGMDFAELFGGGARVEGGASAAERTAERDAAEGGRLRPAGGGATVAERSRGVPASYGNDLGLYRHVGAETRTLVCLLL